MLPVYREPDERPGDEIVYFDYAKSLENRRRPVPWKRVARWGLGAAHTALVISLYRWGEGSQGITHGLFFAAMMFVVALGLIPVIAAERALSGDNFARAKRGPPESPGSSSRNRQRVES